MSDTFAVWIAGRSLLCRHCSHGRFFHGAGRLESVGLGQLESCVDVYVCERCGMVETFVGRPGAEHEFNQPASACLACGKEIPVEANSCPACGWTWGAADEQPAR